MTASGGGETWRCFVGVPLPPSIREPLARAVGAWRADLDAAWTDPAGWHVSLHFIGSVPLERVERIRPALAHAVGGERRFSVRTGGLGAFPSPARADVVYYGVDDVEHRLAGLARAVRHVCAPRDERPADRRFRAHVTLARLRRRRRLDEWLSARRAPSGRLNVTEACLMRSHLGRGPARYEELDCFPLRAASREA